MQTVSDLICSARGIEPELAAIDAAEARRATRILWEAQRRQALTAIVGGLVTMILVVAAVGI